MASAVELAVTAGTARFDPADQRWLDQLATLYAALREEVGAVSARRVPVPGTKGTVDTVILALGSSGALIAAEVCFRAWLARDKTRTLTASWTGADGTEQTVTVTGDNVDRESFQVLVKAIGKRLGGG